MAGRLFVYDPENPNRDSVLDYAWANIRGFGRKVHIVISMPTKSRLQEKKYHAMIGDIARQMPEHPEIAGIKLDRLRWKRVLIDAFRHYTINDPDLSELWMQFGQVEYVPALFRDAEVEINASSRDFGVRLASAFIEYLYWFGTQYDIEWSRAAHDGSEEWKSTRR
jgi:hypothetical protein